MPDKNITVSQHISSSWNYHESDFNNQRVLETVNLRISVLESVSKNQWAQESVSLVNFELKNQWI